MKYFWSSNLLLAGIVFLINAVSLQAQSSHICNTILDREPPKVTLDDAFFEAQVTRYTDALADNPTDLELLTLRGDSHYALRNYQEAINNFMQASEIDPTATYPLARLGDTYQQIFEIEAAINAYTQAIDIDPNYAYAYIKRGVAYRKLGDASLSDIATIIYIKSLDDFNIAIQLDSTSALAFARRSELFLSLKNYDQSLIDAQNALNIGAEFTFAHTVIANFYKGQGDFSSAFVAIQTALNTPTENGTAYAYAFTMVGEMCWRMGKRDLSLNALNIAQHYNNTFSATDIVFARVVIDLRNELADINSLETLNTPSELVGNIPIKVTNQFLDQIYLYGIINFYLLAAEHNPTNPFVFSQLQSLPISETHYQDELTLFNDWQELATSLAGAD